jgi:hypothetical protein
LLKFSLKTVKFFFVLFGDLRDKHAVVSFAAILQEDREYLPNGCDD